MVLYFNTKIAVEKILENHYPLNKTNRPSDQIIENLEKYG